MINFNHDGVTLVFFHTSGAALMHVTTCLALFLTDRGAQEDISLYLLACRGGHIHVNEHH